MGFVEFISKGTGSRVSVAVNQIVNFIELENRDGTRIYFREGHIDVRQDYANVRETIREVTDNG